MAAISMVCGAMCLPRTVVAVVILLVDLDFVGQPRDVRDVDLHGAVAEGFHELVVLQAAILGLVGMPDDHFVDVGLGEFLRLDLVLLAGPQQVVEERHVELEHFDELDRRPDWRR